MSTDLQSQQKPKSKIAKNVIATNLAYAADPFTAKLGVLERKEIQGGTFLLSDMHEGANAADFRAAVFIDPVLKKITYAVAGTRVKQGAGKAISDLRDDIRLAGGIRPRKIPAMQELNKIILDLFVAESHERYINERMRVGLKLGQKFDVLSVEEKKELRSRTLESITPAQLKSAGAKALEGYEIDFTGHSLGAVLSDCGAADMVLQMNKRGMNPGKSAISSVTFDNPGAVTPVKALCKEYGNGSNIDAIKQYVDYKVFNNRENLINTLDKQVGTEFTIVPKDQKPLNPFSAMCRHIAHKCRTVVAKAFFKGLSQVDITRQVGDHALTNFQQVLDEGKGHVRAKDGNRLMTIEEVTTGKEPLIYDEVLFKELKNIVKNQPQDSSESKQTPGFSMQHPVTKAVTLEFSYDQLKEAIKPQTPPISDVDTASKKSGFVEKVGDKATVGLASGPSKAKKASFISIFSSNKGPKKPNPKREYVQRSATDVVAEKEKQVKPKGHSRV